MEADRYGRTRILLLQIINNTKETSKGDTQEAIHPSCYTLAFSSIAVLRHVKMLVVQVSESRGDSGRSGDMETIVDVTLADVTLATEVSIHQYHPPMATFNRTDSRLLSELSWHTNLILGLEDLQDTDFQVHSLFFSTYNLCAKFYRPIL